MFPLSQRRQATYRLIAGNLSLDFVNTLGGSRAGETDEYLVTYADLISWGLEAGLLSRPVAQKLLQGAQRNPDRAAEVLDRARSLREAIYRILSASRAKRSPPAEDLFTVSREAALAMTRARLTPVKAGLIWDWPETSLDLDRVLWPVSRNAAELLTSPEMEKVHECASETCTWVFRDTSKNHSRRWCDMRDCGNRAKARRFRAR